MVKASPPTDPASPAQYMDKVQLMYDLARLAFETDSTRAITLMLDSVGTPVVQIAGATITDGYHNLSHHGMAEDKLTQLKAIDEWHMKLLADLFTRLEVRRRTARRCSTARWSLRLQPRRRQRALDHEPADALRRRRLQARPAPRVRPRKNYPLPNLFVSMLQRMGIEEAGFGPSTGTMCGLEMAWP